MSKGRDRMGVSSCHELLPLWFCPIHGVSGCRGHLAHADTAPILLAGFDGMAVGAQACEGGVRICLAGDVVDVQSPHVRVSARLTPVLLRPCGTQRSPAVGLAQLAVGAGGEPADNDDLSGVEMWLSGHTPVTR